MDKAREMIAGIIKGPLKWTLDGMESDPPPPDEAADAILAALPEIIKGMLQPLEWVESENYKMRQCGKYIIQNEYDAEGNSTWAFGVSGILVSDHKTLVCAIEAANAHNAAQVLKALGMGEGE